MLGHLDLAQTFRQAVLAYQPKAYLPLDDNGNAKYQDIAGGRQGSLTLAPVASPQLPGLGTAFTFNGTSNSVQASDSGLPTGTAARSLLAVITTTSSSTTADILGYGTTSTNHDFCMRCNNGQLALYQHAGVTTFGGSIKDGLPHLCGLTFDGTNARAYVDGVKVGSDQTPSVSTTLAGATGLQIAVFSDFFPGVISDAAVFDRELTAADWGYLNRVLRSN